MAIEITCPHCGKTTEWYNVSAILPNCIFCLRPLDKEDTRNEEKGLKDNIKTEDGNE